MARPPCHWVGWDRLGVQRGWREIQLSGSRELQVQLLPVLLYP